MFPREITLKDNRILTIALAQPGQAEEYIAFAREVAGNSEMMRTEGDEYPAPEQMKQILEAGLKEGISLRLTGMREGRIIANLVLHRTFHRRTVHAGLLGMMVHDDCRGLGIGRHLLQSAIDWAREQKMTKIDLHVRMDNPAALTLYKNAGFEIEGIMRRGLCVNGVMMDVYYMGLLID